MAKTKNGLGQVLQRIDETKVYLENDVNTAIRAFRRKSFGKKRRAIGFFGTLRMVFPVIDCLGSWYVGSTENTTKAAIKFIRDYLGKPGINSDYRRVGPFVYLVYRHGLAHQDQPKHFQYKHRSISKLIGLSNPDSRHKSSGHLKFDGKMIGVDGPQLYKDLLQAIEEYKKRP